MIEKLRMKYNSIKNNCIDRETFLKNFGTVEIFYKKQKQTQRKLKLEKLSNKM